MTGILSWIVRSWTDVENNIVSVERVKEYNNTAKEVSQGHNSGGGGGISDRTPPPPRSAVSRAHATIRGSVQWLRLCQPFTGSLGFSVVSFVEWLMAVAGLWSWIRAVAEPSALMSWQAAWTLEDSFLPSDWPSTGNIEFEDYRLQYREGLDWALNNISINILDKEKVQKAFDHY